MPRQILILIKCDQCDAETDDNKTLIRLNGRNEIETDLCADHRLEVETFLAPFMAKGRKPEVASVGRDRAFLCPWPDCEINNNPPRSKAGRSIHVKKRHGGLNPDGSQHKTAQLSPDDRDEARDTSCVYPGCGTKWKGQLGVSIHSNRTHGMPQFTAEEIAAVRAVQPGPDSAGSPPSAESPRRRRGAVKKAVAAR